MPGSLSGQSIDVLTPIALFILCDQVMRGWWAMVGKEQLGWKSLEDNSSLNIVSLYPVAFKGLRYRGHDLFFYNNLQEAQYVTAANCSN